MLSAERPDGTKYTLTEAAVDVGLLIMISLTVVVTPEEGTVYKADAEEVVN